ncbi:acyl-CoA thioesterase [Planococcus citreus]|uniref:Acyl-CoA thioester hydrolase n=1 Tax=Planococcus citreus TaxID=1373 RepID=A0A497YMG1_9BACL|nr:thioesterase family protein [Planococcus citreus]RLJ86940.1 acyl-CoA thioester hydrolase [Planococcus citreus]
MYISEKEIEIRYAETDQMGVVYHANYLIWLELGRTQLIEDLGFTYAGMESQGFLSPVTDISIQYKAALRYGQKARVKTWVESHGRLRTTYGYEVLHEDGTLAAKATSEHVVVKKDSFRPVPLAKVAPEWDAKYKEVVRGAEDGIRNPTT